MIKRIFVTSFLAGVMLSANAQDWKRTQNWYFGDKAGLSFATDPPTVLTDGAMYALEGCATISDTNGNLLFYTNGLTVWNQNHNVMQNGFGLLSNQSFAQAALIVPQPGNDSIYFLFTPGNYLRYSIINTKRNNGLGEVIAKNIELIQLGTEKLAATYHANGHDIWVVSHGAGTNHFISFLVTPLGVDSCPIISEVGSIMPVGPSVQLEMHFSPSGRLACVSFATEGFVELLEFDNGNGSFSYPIKITTFPRWIPGIIFSADDKTLILSARDGDETWIRAYNLDQKSDPIFHKNFQILHNGSAEHHHCQFVYTPNRDIFFNWIDKTYLGKIEINLNGDLNFIDSFVSINPGKSLYGMPQFISSYFYRPSLDFKYKTTCDDHTVYFEGQFSDSNASPRWSIFQGSNLIYTSQYKAYSYQFTDTGEYLVRLVASSDTVNKNISIEPNLLGYADTIVCNSSEIELNIPSNFRCINWQDGSGASRYTINQSGTYYVSAYNQKGCLVSDTIQVKFGGVPKPNIRRSGDSLHTDSTAHSYIWHLNNAPISNTTASIRVTEQGTYRLETSDTLGCAAVSEPFQVEVLSIHSIKKPTFNIYPNPSLLGSEIQIESESLIHSIKITDLSGKTVYQKKDLNQNQLTLKLSKRGVYIFTINGSNHYRMLIE